MSGFINFEIKVTILKYSLLLFFGFLIEWFSRDLLQIPENIPNTKFKVSGLIIFFIILSVMIAAQREVLRKKNNSTISNLTLISLLVAFLSETLFQALIQVSTATTFYLTTVKIFTMTIYMGVISFFIAYWLKKKNIWILILMILAVMIMISLLKKYNPSLFGQ